MNSSRMGMDGDTLPRGVTAPPTTHGDARRDGKGGCASAAIPHAKKRGNYRLKERVPP